MGGRGQVRRNRRAMSARSVRLVLGFSPGSLSDHIARILQDALSVALGAPVNIELKPGGQGIPAALEVARSAPDGATLFMATLGTHAITSYLEAQQPYDPLADFTPLALVSRSPMLLACHPSLGATDVRSLIEVARQREVSYATSAIGGAPHLAAALFERLTGVRMRHVRYDKTQRLYEDLAAGRVDSSFNNIISMLPRCRSGALTALAVSSRERASIAADIPTIAECGAAGYDMTNWTGIVAPRGMVPELASRLSAAIDVAVRSESVSAALRAQGIAPCGGTAEEFAAFISSERERWQPVLGAIRASSDEHRVY